MVSVNNTTEKLAPKEAFNQIGESLSRIIHAFAEVDPTAKVFMAKWDIKDGFWRMDCEEGEEWNFAYILPQPEGEPIKLVIPTSLQMGWVELPPYFCATTETARGVSTEYINTEVGSLPTHKFQKYAVGDVDYATLPEGIVHLRTVCVSTKLVAPVSLTPLLETQLPCYSSLK